MHNLIAFFRRFRIFLLFALLQILAIATYFTYSSVPRAQYLTSASMVTGKILTTRNEFTKHWNLSHSNEVLQKENIYLHEHMPASFIRLQNGKTKINDTIYKLQYTYTPAIIINSTHTKRNNYFTLNIGSSQGIKRKMGVFSSKGVIGTIHNVSTHFSVVKSLLTENINTDVMIEESGANGILKWNGNDATIGTITGVSNDIKIKKGAKVVTRGGGGIFPRGLILGHVLSYKAIEGKSIWDIEIRYSEDFRKVQNVYVIKNLFLNEQKELEDSVLPDDQKQN